MKVHGNPLVGPERRLFVRWNELEVVGWNYRYVTLKCPAGSSVWMKADVICVAGTPRNYAPWGNTFCHRSRTKFSIEPPVIAAIPDFSGSAQL
ncbi:MAG: hypothetical protein WAJ88_09960 [Pseudolabrys sp.]